MSSSRFNTALVLEFKKATATMVVKRSTGTAPPKPTDIADALGISALSIEWLAGDGSDRCYYRLTSPQLTESLVLMQLSGNDAQALLDNGYDWIKIAEILSEHGIPVPKVITPMPKHSALVIEDYGDVMLEGKVYELADKNQELPVRELYKKAALIVGQFLMIAAHKDAVWCTRSFDADRFVWELNFFIQKYAINVASLSFSSHEKAIFEQESRLLSEKLAEKSRYFVHRDFHSRNIMVKNNKLAIIDFQDARFGPPAYDLVSLFFDSYVPFSRSQRREMLEDAIDNIEKHCGGSVANEIRDTWKLTLLQRQLKAIGSFGFLTIDKQRGNYLKYVSPALATLEEQDVFDARWPFISGELVQRLKASLSSTASQ